MSQDLLPQFAGQPLVNPPVAVPSSNPSLGPDTVGPGIPTGGVQEVYADVTSSAVTASYTPPQPGNLVGEYLQYRLTTHYIEDLGLRAIPVGGPPGTPQQVVRLHAGTFYKVVNFLVSRAISLPVLPSSDTQNANETLYARRISPATPSDLPDGNVAWIVSGQYIYLMRVGPTEKDILMAGISPLAQLNNTGSTAGQLPPSVWNQNLIGPSPLPAAAVGLGLSPITF